MKKIVNTNDENCINSSNVNVCVANSMSSIENHQLVTADFEEKTFFPEKNNHVPISNNVVMFEDNDATSNLSKTDCIKEEITFNSSSEKTFSPEKNNHIFVTNNVAMFEGNDATSNFRKTESTKEELTVDSSGEILVRIMSPMEISVDTTCVSSENELSQSTDLKIKLNIDQKIEPKSENVNLEHQTENISDNTESIDEVTSQSKDMVLSEAKISGNEETKKMLEVVNNFLIFLLTNIKVLDVILLFVYMSF